MSGYSGSLVQMASEKRIFDTGNMPFKFYNLGRTLEDVRVGMMICFDWFFPEVAQGTERL